MLRIDLHIHTPHSVCYSDRSVVCEEIVQVAIDKGLDGIAITDHHAFAGALEVALAASGTPLKVLPGMEITTLEGHFVALFDPAAGPDIAMPRLLQWLGISPDQYGDGHVLAARSAEALLGELNRIGCIGIAAHIDRWPTGLLETSQSRSVKQSIHADPNLAALEITNLDDLESWVNGSVRGFPKPHACVQSSDAHGIRDIGRRVTLLDTDCLTLATVREVFSAPTGRIQFPQS